MDERLTELTIRSLVERLASSDPVPGGGSASALAGAMGAALVHMVVELTVDRPAAAGHEETLTEMRTAADWLAVRAARPGRARREGVCSGGSSPGGCRRSRSRNARPAPRSLPPPFARRPASRSPRRKAASEVLELAEPPRADRQPQRRQRRRRRRPAGRDRGARRRAERRDQPVRASPPTRRCAARQASEIERLLAGLDERERTVRDAVAERLR